MMSLGATTRSRRGDLGGSIDDVNVLVKGTRTRSQIGAIRSNRIYARKTVLVRDVARLKGLIHVNEIGLKTTIVRHPMRKVLDLKDHLNLERIGNEEELVLVDNGVQPSIVSLDDGHNAVDTRSGLAGQAGPKRVVVCLRVGRWVHQIVITNAE